MATNLRVGRRVRGADAPARRGLGPFWSSAAVLPASCRSQRLCWARRRPELKNVLAQSELTPLVTLAESPGAASREKPRAGETLCAAPGSGSPCVRPLPPPSPSPPLAHAAGTRQSLARMRTIHDNETSLSPHCRRSRSPASPPCRRERSPAARSTSVARHYSPPVRTIHLISEIFLEPRASMADGQILTNWMRVFRASRFICVTKFPSGLPPPPVPLTPRVALLLYSERLPPAPLLQVDAHQESEQKLAGI